MTTAIPPVCAWMGCRKPIIGEPIVWVFDTVETRDPLPHHQECSRRLERHLRRKERET